MLVVVTCYLRHLRLRLRLRNLHLHRRPPPTSPNGVRDNPGDLNTRLPLPPTDDLHTLRPPPNSFSTPNPTLPDSKTVFYVTIYSLVLEIFYRVVRRYRLPLFRIGV